MSIDRIGSITNMTFVGEAQTAAKKHESPEKEINTGDVVSIGKSEAISTLQVKWPPLLPIGHTQGIYDMDE